MNVQGSAKSILGKVCGANFLQFKYLQRCKSDFPESQNCSGCQTTTGLPQGRWSQYNVHAHQGRSSLTETCEQRGTERKFGFLCSCVVSQGKKKHQQLNDRTQRGVRLTKLTASSEAASVTPLHSHISTQLSDAVSISSGSVE